MNYCCKELEDADNDEKVGIEYVDSGDPGGAYTLGPPTYLYINFCPWCGSVLPGALVTDWELHEKCERCHWTCDGNSDRMPEPPCICSKGYEELKRIQDETHSSN